MWTHLSTQSEHTVTLKSKVLVAPRYRMHFQLIQGGQRVPASPHIGCSHAVKTKR